MAFVDNKAIDSGVAVSEATAGDFMALLKPRVMSLVVFTALVGMLMSPVPVDPVMAVIAIICIAVGAGASGALNMWYDADIDMVMKRTAARPVPSGKVAPEDALAFGLILSGFSVMTLGLLVNWLSAALLAFTIFFYAVVYTMWLKRRTPQNIVIGGAAGALPPVIGWAAAADAVSVESLVLFAIIFLWTPPHFWALALFKQAEYARAGVPMMPNVTGAAATKRQILLYGILLALCGVLPFAMGFATAIYGAASTLLGAAFVRACWRVYTMDEGDTKMKPAKALFGFSLLYLFAIFALLLAEAIAFRLLPGLAA
jgi:protoheme IX farnesyltransferase